MTEPKSKAELIAEAIEALLTNLAGFTFRKTFDHVPKDLVSLPAATVQFVGLDQSFEATGGLASVRWKFEVSIYIDLAAKRPRKAEADLASALISIASAIRSDPTLDGLVELLDLEDGEKPEPIPEAGYYLKTISIVATTEEG